MKPKLLDLFCGAGGAAKGYQRAGFYVVGVDLRPQPHYCGDVFIQDDAREWMHYGFPRAGDFDAVHASPPCQQYSRALKHLARDEPKLIDECRDYFHSYLEIPWVIENVPGAPIETARDIWGHEGFQLCGTSFGLRVERHRLFESNVPMVSSECHHVRHAVNPHNQRGRDRIYAEFGRQNPERVWKQLMGVEWMTDDEAREAIPPAYTEWIGRQLLSQQPHRPIQGQPLHDELRPPAQ